MVRPAHVCVGVVFLQPQFTVLMAYQPGASGVPAFSPTVSPGCVTDAARAGAAPHSDRKPAVANFVSLLFMFSPLKVLGVCVLARPYEQPNSNRDEVGAIGPGAVHFGSLLPKCCGELTAYKSYSIPAGVLGAFAVSHANIWHRGRKVTLVAARYLACRLPYRFPRGNFTRLLRVRVPAPWLPYRFPRW
jgi:hypothetical protein